MEIFCYFFKKFDMRQDYRYMYTQHTDAPLVFGLWSVCASGAGSWLADFLASSTSESDWLFRSGDCVTVRLGVGVAGLEELDWTDSERFWLAAAEEM